MFHFTTRAILAGCVLAALSLGCENQQQMEGEGMSGASAAPTTSRSRLLMDITRRVLTDALNEREQSGEEMPEDWQSDQFKSDVVESLRLQFPEAYEVTDAERQRYQRGRFDDEANAQRIDSTLSQIEQQNVELGTVSGYLADLYRQDQLRGVGLVLANRLLDARLNAEMMGQMQGAMGEGSEGGASSSSNRADEDESGGMNEDQMDQGGMDQENGMAPDQSDQGGMNEGGMDRDSGGENNADGSSMDDSGDSDSGSSDTTSEGNDTPSGDAETYQPGATDESEDSDSSGSERRGLLGDNPSEGSQQRPQK